MEGKLVVAILLLSLVMVNALFPLEVGAQPLARDLTSAVSHHRSDLRTRRGLFKNTGNLATARGFGKRISSPAFTSSHQGPVDQDQDGSPEANEERYSVDWLVNVAVSKPALIHYLMNRFVDVNNDGVVSSSELVDALTD